MQQAIKGKEKFMIVHFGTEWLNQDQVKSN